jgi:hypothetical protein
MYCFLYNIHFLFLLIYVLVRFIEVQRISSDLLIPSLSVVPKGYVFCNVTVDAICMDL